MPPPRWTLLVPSLALWHSCTCMCMENLRFCFIYLPQHSCCCELWFDPWWHWHINSCDTWCCERCVGQQGCPCWSMIIYPYIWWFLLDVLWMNDFYFVNYWIVSVECTYHALCYSDWHCFQCSDSVLRLCNKEFFECSNYVLVHFQFPLFSSTVLVEWNDLESETTTFVLYWDYSRAPLSHRCLGPWPLTYNFCWTMIYSVKTETMPHFWKGIWLWLGKY